MPIKMGVRAAGVEGRSLPRNGIIGFDDLTVFVVERSNLGAALD